jgi:hypothetical protein
MRAIFLFSRNGTNNTEPLNDYTSWYNVDWSQMDNLTYPRSHECVIDDYNLIEDTYDAPHLIANFSQCNGTTILSDTWSYPSLTFCDNLVKTSTACIDEEKKTLIGDGHFFYS